jgi:hypothetical protein
MFPFHLQDSFDDHCWVEKPATDLVQPSSCWIQYLSFFVLESYHLFKHVLTSGSRISEADTKDRFLIIGELLSLKFNPYELYDDQFLLSYPVAEIVATNVDPGVRELTSSDALMFAKRRL